MADISDEKFLGYVEIHSRTERHAFSREDANRLMNLAGVAEMRVGDCGLGGFVGIDAGEADRLIDLARKRKEK